MIKRLFSLLAALVLLTGSGLCSFAGGEEAADAFDPKLLQVSNPTPLTGHFFTSMWGASTSDLDVQELLHRYKLVVYDNELGRYRMNHLVVTGAVTQDDPEGNRTYYIALYEDLYYSDGTHITARDFAFTFLLMMDPAIAEAGGTPSREDWIMGAEEYAAGQAETLSGIRIINDYLFSITVKKEYLPYFYELSRFRVSPYPIDVIAPGFSVKDDGEGVYLSGRLSGDLIRETVLDEHSGYMTAPKTVSGPYTIDWYQNGKAHFTLNRRYKGNQKGETPSIPALTYGAESGEDMVRKLESGELGLLNKVTRADTVRSLMNLVYENPDKYGMTSYPRTGMTIIRFVPQSWKVQETAVRKAVFLCLDRESAVEDYLGEFGLVVKGLYGVGQWMVRLLDGPAEYPIPVNEENPTQEELEEYERALAVWQSMDLQEIPDYTLDVEEAIRLLEESGWTLDRDGGPYKTGIRHKRSEDGQLISLELRAAIPENMREVLEQHWKPYLEQAGIGLELIDRDILDLAEAYRANSVSEVDMVLVGEDFTDQFRLSGGYRQLEADENPEEDTPLEALDKEIDQMSWEVYHTDKSDLQGFIRKWLDTQVKIAETVPVIPFYSNVYFDFYRSELQDYRVERYLGWGNAIVASWIYTPGAERGNEPERPVNRQRNNKQTH